MHTAQFPIYVELRRSLWAFRINCLISAILALMLWGEQLDIGLILVLLLCLVVGISWDARRVRHAVPIRLRLASNGELARWDATECEWQALTVRHVSAISPWLTAFTWADQHGRTHHHCLLADSMPANQFRQLRVWLRWESMRSAATEHAVPRH